MLLMRTVLLQYLKFTDDRQFLCSAVCGVHNADDQQYKEHDIDKAEDRRDKSKTPGDGIKETTYSIPKAAEKSAASYCSWN